MARWWNRLGGEPVGHVASPRFIVNRYRSIDFIVTNISISPGYVKGILKKNNKNSIKVLIVKAFMWLDFVHFFKRFRRLY